MNYDLNLLRTFSALMTERSVTAASQRLGVTQPAVSGSLAKLRRLFDDPLFTRTRYGIVPTKKAEAIAPIVQKALEDLDAVVQREPIFEPKTSVRRFHVAANPYFESVLIPRLAQMVHQQAPQIQLTLVPIGADLAAAKPNGGVTELALSQFDHPPEQVMCQTILKDEFACVVRAENSCVGDMLTIDAYETMKHVLVASPSRLENGVFTMLKQQSIQRKVAIAVSHFLAVAPIIAKTDYCATLPKRIAQQYVGNPRYRVFAPPTDFGQFPMHMVWHPRYDNDAGHQWLRRLIQDICNDLTEPQSI
ncbi:LysR family transcriptional regulator [Leptothoe sp. EHU-05/26/07-4]